MLTTIFVVLYAQSKALIPYLIEEYEERINEPQYTVNENPASAKKEKECGMHQKDRIRTQKWSQLMDSNLRPTVYKTEFAVF